MRNIMSIATLFLTTISLNISASCVESGNVKTCYDAKTGNSYQTYEYGNGSTTYSSNANTGSNWNSTTYRNGNSSTTTGIDKDGNTWISNIYDHGDGIYSAYGSDSDGNSFSKTCNADRCF